GAQYNPANRLTGLNKLVRSRRLFEWKRQRNDWLDNPTRHQCKAVIELLARRARRTEHGDVLKKELRRIEWHKLTGQLPDHDPTPADSHATANWLKQLAADVVDRNIDAEPCVRLFDRVRKILSAPGDDDRVRAERTNLICLISAP